MSALPAEITELSPVPGAAERPAPDGAQLRAERRAQQAAARRARRLWSVVGIAVIGCSVGLTVGILDVLH
jgi:hypothetical protein